MRTARICLAIVLFGLVPPGRAAQVPEPPGPNHQVDRVPDDDVRHWSQRPLADWMAMLDTADAATRRARFDSFAGLGGTNFDPLHPAFLRGLHDPDPGVRFAAAAFVVRELHFSEAEVAEARGVVVRALESDDARDRSRAIRALSSGGRDRAASALPPLIRAVRRGVTLDDWSNIESLFEALEGRAAPAAAELARSLDEAANPTARARVAMLLARIGAPARAEATPALLRALGAAERDVVLTANLALRAVNPDAVPRPSPAARFVAGEVAALNSPILWFSLPAYDRLCQIGPDAVVAIPDILRFFERSLRQVALVDPGEATANLAMLGRRINHATFGDGLTPALLDQIRDDRPELAALACDLIAANEGGNVALLPTLEAARGRTTGQARAKVVEAIGSVGRDRPEGRAALIAALRDPDRWARLGALEGATCHREPTPELVAAVAAARDDADPGVRDEARRLARRFPPGPRPIDPSPPPDPPDLGQLRPGP